MINWKLPQRHAIYDDDHNIIVSAGAGSGKTAVLTERVFQHVVKNIDINRMLVLTFTENAASEMKKRIRDKIIKNEDNVLSQERRADQLNKIDSSYIMTFDAYALSLVKKYHYLLNVDRDISIMNSQVLFVQYDQFLDEIFNSHYESNDPDFLDIINKFCTKNDNIVRSWVLELNKKLNMRYDRDEYLKNYLDRFYSDEMIQSLFASYEKLLRNRVEEIGALISELSKMADIDTLYPGLDNLLAAHSYQDIKTYCRINIGSFKRGEATEEAKALKGQIKKLFDGLIEQTAFEKDELIAQYSQTRSTAQCLIGLVCELNDKIREFKKQAEMYEFHDIFNMAIKLVAEFPEVRKETKNSFDEILIDEYQDTNDLQDLFISYLDDGTNIYMVGDIKQSIYRFRNANPELFRKKYHDYCEGRGGQTIELVENFRSREEVLDDINLIFSRLMDSNIGGVDYDSRQAMVAGNEEYGKAGDTGHDNYLEILSYDKKGYPFEDKSYKPADAEAIIIAEDIADKKKNGYKIMREKKLEEVKFSDFCIIADRSKDFDTYKKVLTAYNIPSYIVADETMKDSDLFTVIKSIFGLLCCLKESADDKLKLYFMSLARSFLVEMSDSELYQIIKDNRVLSCDLMKRVVKIADMADRCTIGELLDAIIEEFDVYQRLNKIGSVDDNNIKINYLYQLAHQLSAMNYSYRDFNTFLDNLFNNRDASLTYKINAPEIDAVKIMTIHKSKGLEFNICYYPHLDSGFNRDDMKQTVTYSRDYGIIVPAYIEGRGYRDTFVKGLHADKLNREDASEKIRLLYVALTRAREKMILIYPAEDYSVQGSKVDEATRLNASKFTILLNALYEVFDKHGYISNLDLTQYDFAKAFKDFSRPLFSRIGNTGEDITLKTEVRIDPVVVTRERYSKLPTLISAEQKKVLDAGTRMHYYLEMLDFVNPDYSAMDSFSRNKIQKFVESDLMKNIARARTYREYEFVYRDNGTERHGFIDLLVEYDDHFDIIDYKLKNIDDEHYDEQLRGYREYISSVSDKPVNCYLYSIMDSTWREVK